jgi:hypothetical protein
MRTLERKTAKLDKVKPFKRLVHFVEGDVWSYQGGNSVVLIRTPDLTVTHTIPTPEIVGMSYHEIERGMWKRWFHGIGPGDVKAYIAGHLRGSDAMGLPTEVFLDVNPTWKSERWHLFESCALHGMHSTSFPPETAAQQLGAPLTRKNLCGACRMLRDQKVT